MQFPGDIEAPTLCQGFVTVLDAGRHTAMLGYTTIRIFHKPSGVRVLLGGNGKEPARFGVESIRHGSNRHTVVIQSQNTDWVLKCLSDADAVEMIVAVQRALQNSTVV